MTTAAARPSKLRSELTNNPYVLPGVDMRLPAGRRYRDIVDAIVAEFGDANSLAVRELATLKFTLELTQADVLRGGSKRARNDLVRIGNLIARRETALRSSGSQPDQTMSLHEYLAANAEAKPV